MTVKDSIPNSYTKTTNSPITSGSGSIWLFYLLSAPTGATKTITATWTGSASASVWADEFSPTGGTAAFDKDLTGTGTSGTTINTPSLTPTNSGSLLYAATVVAANISAPAAGATLGSWTGSGGGINNGNDAEYALSVTGALPVRYTQTTGAWAGMAMAFRFTASASNCQHSLALLGAGCS